MKVLHLMAGADAGGAERFFGRLAVALNAAGVEQEFVIRPNAEREKILSSEGLLFETARFGGAFDFFMTRFKINRVIDRTHPDIVLSWMNRATVHCPLSHGGRGFVHIGTPRGYYDPKYFRRCDHLVVTTEDLKKFYMDAGFAADTISVIQNFVPDVQESPVSRREFDTPDEVPLLLALGRLHENKGFDTLIRSMASLPEHFLWIGGDGPLRSELEALSKECGVADRVRFLGWQNNTAGLYAASDIFVCSSRHEPFGNIIIEAWMHGVPIAAAASEGPAQLLKDGETGLLCGVDDADGLAVAIRRLDEGALAERLAHAGCAAYEAGYSDKAVVPLYLEVFEKVAARCAA